MIELARELGAPANYAGSGGAIVGIVPAGRDDRTICATPSQPRAASCCAATSRRASGFSA